MVHPIAEATETSLFGSLTPSEFYTHHSVSHSSEFITNSTGLKLFTQSWTPLPPRKLLGTLCVLHGFKEDSSWILQLTCVHFAKSGFATCAIDYQGHGNSQDLLLRDHIPDINTVVEDCSVFFNVFRARYPDSLPSFLYGESLGGAIALLIHFSRNQTWNGIILHGAMCKISNKFKPVWPLEYLSPIAAKWIPTWRVVPTRCLPNTSYKEEWKRKLALACPYHKRDGFGSSLGLPTVATGNELLRVCKEVERRFEEVVAPVLIVHGGGDVVCDPSSVEELYERARSKDKTIRVYEGSWHLLVGENDEMVEIVFGEIVQWLRERAGKGIEACEVACGV